MQKGKSQTGASRFDQLTGQTDGLRRRVQHLETQVNQLQRDMAALANLIQDIITASRKAAGEEVHNGQ